MRSRVVRPAALAALAVVASTASSPTSRADGAMTTDPYAVPAAPRPPTLPELTHSETEATLEATEGAIFPNAAGAPLIHAYAQRLALEVPLGLRRWFVGANYELGASAGRVVSGNLEIDGRTLWATRTGLAFGGGLGLIVPTARYDEGSPAAAAALNVATLRPWDESFFTPKGLGVRPFVDVRAIDGAFVAQFRQALELVTPSDNVLGAGSTVYATVGVYLGLWATREIAVGLEAFESYAISDAGVRDGARATVIISPNVRVALPWVEPAISIFTNIGTPLQGASDRIWGFRLAATVVRY